MSESKNMSTTNAAHYPVAMKTATKNKQGQGDEHHVVAFAAKRRTSKTGGRSQAQGGPNRREEYVTSRISHSARDNQVNPQSEHERKANSGKKGFGHVFSGMIRYPTGMASR